MSGGANAGGDHPESVRLTHTRPRSPMASTNPAAHYFQLYNTGWNELHGDNCAILRALAMLGLKKESLS